MKITGLKSGDYESFCLDVTKEEFKKIKNENPDEFDKSYFNENRYRIYIEDILNKILPEASDNDEIEIDINIKKR